ncbi:MAG: DUF523 and DUF1722 domain-containing protein [Syntrophaceae bacterium]|nr:DUF523 and DUF1722 domain-containing protein [Syntrophaceae bacterium]
MINSEKIKLGISACLLGENVRYDGGHKLDKFIKETLGQYVEYIAVCPEVECGLGIPRESMHLEGEPDAPRLVTTRTKIDLTLRMANWAQKRVRELEKEDLCGFIFKSDSPSSGMERVKIYNENKMPVKKGVGIFAKIFMEHFSLLPVEDEGRLHDPDLRENFIERIFALRRWRESLKNTKGRGSLLHFHTAHKLLILSHSTKHYQIMGKLVADQKKIPLMELRGKYEILLLEALSLMATSKKHANVLQHMTGYFKEQLSADEKSELLEIISDYHKGFVPLIVPVTLIRHYARKYRQNYLSGQVYLNPHPAELKLRNHV